MPEKKDAPNPPIVDPSVQLLGTPTGESLDRQNVDDLMVATARERRPGHMTSDDYLKTAPGHQTRIFMALSGIERRRRWIMFFVVSAVVLAGVVAALLLL